MDMPLILHMRKHYAPRSLGRDNDTKAYIETISSRRISHARYSKEQQEYYTAVISLDVIKCNIVDVAS